MKRLILAILFQASIWSYGQSNNPFPYLAEITNSSDKNVHLFVDKTKATIYNKKLKDLDKDHPLYMPEDCESKLTLLAITSIDNSDKKFAIMWGTCPEPEFLIYSPDNISEYYGSVSGLNLYITGNGNLYSSGHINANFNVKKKFKFHEKKITEVKQPHYYVGLKTKTMNPLTLYQSKALKKTVANLPKDYEIEVLLAETTFENEEYYLIKTNFGLIGWTKVKAGQYKSIDIKGIYWNGD